MRVDKILIIGNSGSGKTWLGNKLNNAKGIPLIRMDDLFWEPGKLGQEKKDVAKRTIAIDGVKKSRHWIVEGVFGEIAEHFVDDADLVIWLKLPWEECKANLLARGIEPEKSSNSSEADKAFAELLTWASEYESRAGKCTSTFHEHLCRRAQMSVTLTSRTQIDEFLLSLLVRNRLNQRKTLRLYFQESVPPPGAFGIVSSFTAALRDARQATSRNLDTGAIEGPHAGNWLGAVGYMILLDQIGGIFKPAEAAPVQGPSIIKALRYFSNLNEPEVDAIYALRCAFTHDYCLCNIQPSKPHLTHRFTLIADDRSPVVQLPSTQWNGEVTDLTPTDTLTTINLLAFGNLVEGISRSVRTLALNEQLDIVLDGEDDELIQRYSFAIWPDRSHQLYIRT